MTLSIKCASLLALPRRPAIGLSVITWPTGLRVRRDVRRRFGRHGLLPASQGPFFP